VSQIIFFDGVCLLCNGAVDFLLQCDVERHFQFSPLQGERAKVLLPPNLRAAGFDTMVLWSQGQVFVRSDAVLMVFSQLGGFWPMLKVLWAVPRPIRDLIYRLVSVNRYAWFGQREICRLPTAEERDRFLD
jgi:predicted DCC family thiol-disulfide oxidoreductase YuxK